MPRFDPGPGDEVRLVFAMEQRSFTVVPHPQVPAMAHAMEGAKAVVYRLCDQRDGAEYALKIFKKRFREPELVRICQELNSLRDQPGLAVCERVCLSPDAAPEPLRQFPDLEYAVLMPWIDGRSWFDSLQTADAPILDLDRTRARRLATHLGMVLADLERQDIAHCDLSAANLLINEGDLKIDLIDVEDLYAPGLDTPTAPPAGTPGYQHSTADEGLWEPAADRFAGAVLLAEILGWFDPQVRASVFGESYFDPGELQKSRTTARYQTLHRALQEQSSTLASLWEEAWCSPTLDACPTLASWDEACRALFPFEPIDLSQIVIEIGPKVFWSSTLPIRDSGDPPITWEPLSPDQAPPPVRWDDPGAEE